MRQHRRKRDSGADGAKDEERADLILKLNNQKEELIIDVVIGHVTQSSELDATAIKGLAAKANEAKKHAKYDGGWCGNSKNNVPISIETGGHVGIEAEKFFQRLSRYELRENLDPTAKRNWRRRLRADIAASVQKGNARVLADFAARCGVSSPYNR